jgi:predicted AlkP superfamily pyrophosphatase or phosphodiesterase
MDWHGVNLEGKPTPVVPAYSGANVRGIIPALLGPGAWGGSLPDWFPEPVRDARQVVVLVLDGLGWHQLQARLELAPNLASLTGRSITTVAPTTTATALCSIATGLTPGEHGLVGYRMLLGGEVMNVLRWNVDHQDRRRSLPPADVQPFPAFLGHAVPVISPAELQHTAFTEAHLRGSKPVGWRAASSIPVEVGHQLRAGERVVYAYYGGVDKIAHERGFGEYYDAEVVAADRLVRDVLDQLPPGAALLVTADHGQVQVGDAIVHLSEGVLGAVVLQSGEGRFRWLHARRGAVADVVAAAEDEVGSLAWVVTRDEVLDEHWFGPTVPPAIAARLGDVALVAFADVSFYEPSDSGPFELMCRHGSLTPAEVDVPLLGAVR